jgi:hypothetical protein
MAGGNGVIAQLRTIAAAVEVLPDVRDQLSTLDAHVIEMSAEVSRMRAGVDALGVSVAQLNDQTESLNSLDTHFVGLRADMAGLDRHFRALRGTLAPIQGALAGVGRLGGRLRGS